MHRVTDASAHARTGPGQVTVVTVTFGMRQDLLRRMLSHCKAQGVGRMVVVDNGSTWDVAADMQAVAECPVEVVRLARNLGSAAGYAAGMEHALRTGAQFIWLVDDDNVPEAGCLECLLRAHDSVAPQRGGRLMVAALRVTQAAGNPEFSTVRERSGSFMHFHLLDVPRRMWNRLSRRGTEGSQGAVPEIAYVSEYPYSGLLFHRSVLEALGMPRADFVLYMDDIEFTRRLRTIGGVLAVVTRARIQDLHLNVSGDARLFGALRRWDRWRSYYLHRNKVWLDHHPLPCKGRPVTYYVNMTAWLSVLLVVALVSNRLPEFRVLLTSIRDGIRGRMGLNDAFPLP